MGFRKNVSNLIESCKLQSCNVWVGSKFNEFSVDRKSHQSGECVGQMCGFIERDTRGWAKLVHDFSSAHSLFNLLG